MAGEGIAAQQMLQQQAALEQRNAGMQNMMKQQAASQIMRQIAMGEVQREMARESQTGRALGSAADRESRRDVGKARMETQKELEEKQRLLGLIGGAAEAAGALGAYMVSQDATPDKAAEAAEGRALVEAAQRAETKQQIAQGPFQSPGLYEALAGAEDRYGLEGMRERMAARQAQDAAAEAAAIEAMPDIQSELAAATGTPFGFWEEEDDDEDRYTKEDWDAMLDVI